MLISEAVTKQCCNMARNCLAGGCMAWKDEPKYEWRDAVVPAFNTTSGRMEKKVERQRFSVAPDSGYCTIVEGGRHE